MKLPRHILARGGSEPNDVECMCDGNNSQGVCLGDIRDCWVRKLCNNGAVIAGPGKE
jgi:hypothetical protein